MSSRATLLLLTCPIRCQSPNCLFSSVFKKSILIYQSVPWSPTLPCAGHLGPVYALSRNPFAIKYFLSAGDWTSRIWNEDLKTPIITSPYAASPLTAAKWSPSRRVVGLVCYEPLVILLRHCLRHSTISPLSGTTRCSPLQACGLNFFYNITLYCIAMSSPR